MGQTAKRHHYVPQFYLRGFANERKQISTVPLPGDRTYVQPVANAASVNNFHTVVNHPEGPDAFETLLGRIEDDASRVFRKIHQGVWPLDTDDRAELAEFIALQAVRGSNFRRDLSYVMRQILRVQVGTAGKKRFQARLENMMGTAAAEEHLDTLWEQATSPEGPPVELSAAGHISQLPDLVAAVTPLLEQRVWGLFRFGDLSLITSDTPVVLHSDPANEITESLGFGTAHMVSYPLSRKVGLLMSQIIPPSHAEAVSRGEHDYEEEATPETARFFNLSTAFNASEILFHHADDAAFVPETLPPRNPVNVGMSGMPSSFADEPWGKPSK